MENRILQLEAQCKQTSPSGHGQGLSVENAPSDDDSLDKGDALIMVPSPDGMPDDNASSISASLQSIAHLVGRSDLVDRTVPRAGQKAVSPLRRSRSFGMLARAASYLPSRPVADAIMFQFWTYVHPIFPVLHRPTMESVYGSLWTSDHGGAARHSVEEPKSMGLLNIMLALGCQSSGEEDKAGHFYRKSMEYYSKDTIDIPSIETVQVLLLTGLYLQSTKYASRCWSIVGMALRTARYLRLDQVSPRSPLRSQLEEEMRRRVWHSCIIVDRSVAPVKFGSSPRTGG